MAHVEENTGKKSSVVELNLVPFIDLMSVCIIFLLITAVWIQISMIQLGTSVYSKKIEDQEPAALTPNMDIPFRVDVLSGGYKVVLGAQAMIIPLKSGGAYDHVKFRKQLKDIKNLYPEKVDVVVTSEDAMLYKHLIMAMDLLLTAGFSGISIATGPAA